ncbi:hypothetical protein KJ830_04055 [bacterium]|nr:hypothetical protein [bacterium]
MTEKRDRNDKEECGNDTKEFFLNFGEAQGIVFTVLLIKSGEKIIPKTG